MNAKVLLVSLMAIVISTTAFNTVSAQNVRHADRGGHRTEARSSHGNGGSHHDGVRHDGGNKGGGYHAPARHGNAGHVDAHHVNVRHSAPHSHVGHYADVRRPHYYGEHVYVGHRIHRPHPYINYAPVIRYRHPVVIHHYCPSYVLRVGDYVDALPVGCVPFDCEGVHLFRAFGHIFRPVLIDNVIRFLIE